MSDLEVFSISIRVKMFFHDNGKDVHGDDDDDDGENDDDYYYHYYGCNPTRALYSAGLFSRHNLHQPYITFGGSPA